MNTVLVVIALIIFFPLVGMIMSSAFDKADKEAQKGNGSCLGLILGAVLIGVLIMSLQQCKQCSDGYYGGSWQPRHTQIEKPVLNIVNELNFNNYTVS